MEVDDFEQLPPISFAQHFVMLKQQLWSAWSVSKKYKRAV